MNLKACEEEKQSEFLSNKNTVSLVHPFSHMEEHFRKLVRPSNGLWDAVEANMPAFELILSRLPVKTVLTSKSISKLWHNVLSTNRFKLSHQYFSKLNPKYLVFHDAGEHEDGIAREIYQMEPNGDYTQSYVIPEINTLCQPHILSSFNGLICFLESINSPLSSCEVDIHICNPATREVLKLPRGQPSMIDPIYGLLCSIMFHVYKIFRFFSDLVDMTDGCVQCEVYSSLTRSWRRLGRFDVWPMVNPFRPLVADHVCLDDKLYWLIGDADAATKPSWIMMVDIHEIFHRIDLPKKANGSFFGSFLIDFRGKLCFINWSESYIFIWGYEEEKKSWQLLDMPQFPDWSEAWLFDSVVANRDEILFVYNKKSSLRHEIVYDVGLKMWKEFSIPEADKDKQLLVFPFVETLFPCGQFPEECRGTYIYYYARQKVTVVAE